MAASVIAPMLSKLETKQSTVDQINDAATVLATLSNNKKLANIYLEAGAVQGAIKFMKTHSMRKYSISYEQLLLLLARIGAASARGGKELIKRDVFSIVIKSVKDKHTNRRIRTNGMLILLGIAVWPENRLATCGSRNLEAVYQAMSRAQAMMMKRPMSQPSGSSQEIKKKKQHDEDDNNNNSTNNNEKNTHINEEKDNKINEEKNNGEKITNENITAITSIPNIPNIPRPSTVSIGTTNRPKEKEDNNSGLLGWACATFLWYAASHSSCRLPIVRAGLLKPIIFFTEQKTIDIIDKFEEQEDIKYKENFFVANHKADVLKYANSKARFPSAGCLWHLARDGLCRSVIVSLRGVDGLLYILEDVVLSDPVDRGSIVERFNIPEKSGLHDEILYLNKKKK